MIPYQVQGVPLTKKNIDSESEIMSRRSMSYGTNKTAIQAYLKISAAR